MRSQIDLRRSAVLLLLMTLLPGTSRAQSSSPSQLSLTEAVREALVSNLNLAARRRALAANRQQVDIERASLPEEVVCPLKEAPEKAPYFSMILLVKGGDPWL